MMFITYVNPKQRIYSTYNLQIHSITNEELQKNLPVAISQNNYNALNIKLSENLRSSDFSFLKNIEGIFSLNLKNINEKDTIEILQYSTFSKLLELHLECNNFNFMQFLPNLEALTLDAKRKNIVDFSNDTFENLKELTVFDACDMVLKMDLPKLKVLILDRIKKIDLGEKSSVEFLGIGSCSLLEVAGLENLHHLRGLSIFRSNSTKNIDFIENNILLEAIELDSMSSLRKLPNFKRHTKLKDVFISNLNNLEDFTGLADNLSLEQFYCVSDLPYKVYEPLLSCKNLKKIHVGGRMTSLNRKMIKDMFKHIEPFNNEALVLVKI